MTKNNSQKFTEDYQYRIHRIKYLAKKYLWEFIFKNNDTLIFTNNKNVIISVNAKNLSVITDLIHPKQGKTSLKRENLSLKLIEKIFINPRTHMPKSMTSNYINC